MKKEKLNVGKEVVTVNTNVKRVVAKKKETEAPKEVKKVEVSEEAKNLSKSLSEHLEENINNTKAKRDYKSLATGIIFIIIIGICILLLFDFFDKYNDGKLTKTTAPTTTRGLVTTTTTTKEIHYDTTTRPQTKATHTIFDKNRR